jgi:hypothetical protein
MNKPYPWIVITVLISITGSALSLMNNACKSGTHSWCAPTRVKHHPYPERQNLPWPPAWPGRFVDESRTSAA